MTINENEKEQAKILVEKLLKHKDKLSYINIGSNNEYLGWVADFRIKDQNNQSIRLDLTNENDLFLLFVLAVGWSRTGIWENSAYLVSYLKVFGKDSWEFWKSKENWQKEEAERFNSANLIIEKTTSEIPPRKEISFRKDIFKSINVLADHWEKILSELEASENEKNYNRFMEYLRSIEGLGVGDRRILIKIPLILRELRCQGIYQNIPGAFCCVVDARVLEAAQQLNIALPKPVDLDSLIKVSTKIYSLFGDLYDLPLFAYADLEKLDQTEK